MRRRQPFYVALGVPRGADPETVQVAYRKVVARYQQSLQSEPSAGQPEPLTGFAVRVRSYSERRHSGQFDDPEPLIPERGDTDLDRFFEGFVPEVSPLRRGRAQLSGEGKDLFVELRLVPHEAQQGGLFSVHVPVVRGCPSCAERDQSERLACRRCHGSGRITEDRTIDVAAPPGVKHGEAARIPMEDVGIEETDLIVKVVVT